MTPDSIRAQKPKTGKSRMVFVSLLALFSILLAACGSTTSTGNTGSSQPIMNIMATTGGTFAASNFNPFLNTNGGGLFGAAGNIYEPLVFVNRYTGVSTPWLAKTATVSSDAKSVTFVIRDGVKWSNGTPFTMKDVTFTLDMLKAHPALDLQGLFSGGLIDTYTATDANTLQITLKKPTSTILWSFSNTPIVSQQEYSQFSDPVTAVDSKPVGTGPYLFDKFTTTAYTFKKNPNYWNTAMAPKVDELRYLAVNDNTAAQNQVTSGAIDWAGIGWQKSFDAQFLKDSVHHHEWFIGTNTVYLELNTTRAPFNDVKVRQAINLAINRDEIHTKAAFFANPSNAAGIVTPTFQSYVPSAYTDPLAQNAAQAATLLQQAGYTKGPDGILQKNGQKLSFKIQVPSGWSDWEASITVISSDLKAVGIDATEQAQSTSDVMLAGMKVGKFDAALMWSDAGPTPYYPLNDLLRSSYAHNGANPAKGTNYEGWNDPATDKLLDQYLASPDPTVQKQAIAGIADIMATQVPAIPLDYNAGWDEYTTTNFTGFPDANNAYDYGSPFNGEDSTYVLLHLSPVK